jgi:hypothetical protein
MLAVYNMRPLCKTTDSYPLRYAPDLYVTRLALTSAPCVTLTPALCSPYTAHDTTISNCSRCTGNMINEKVPHVDSQDTNFQDGELKPEMKI